jgi:hypothetical protein
VPTSCSHTHRTTPLTVRRGDTRAQVEYDTEPVLVNQTEVAEEMKVLDEIDQREAETLAEDLTFYQEDQVRARSFRLAFQM